MTALDGTAHNETVSAQKMLLNQGNFAQVPQPGGGHQPAFPAPMTTRL